jgi:hypothetical protein
MRAMLAISAAMDLELCLMYIDTAFLYAPIKEDVFIKRPMGFIDGTSKLSSREMPFLRAETVPPRHQRTHARLAPLSPLDTSHV